MVCYNKQKLALLISELCCIAFQIQCYGLLTPFSFLREVVMNNTLFLLNILKSYYGILQIKSCPRPERTLMSHGSMWIPQNPKKNELKETTVYFIPIVLLFLGHSETLVSSSFLIPSHVAHVPL